MPAGTWKYALPSLASTLILGFSCLGAGLLWTTNQHNLSDAIASDSDHISNDMQRSLVACGNLMHDIEFLHASIATPDEKRFSLYARTLSENSECSGLTSLSLSRLLIPEQREAFALQQQTNGSRNFRITPSGERALYAPIISSIATPGSTAWPLGKDLLANTELQRTLTQARDSGLPEISDSITQSSENQSDESAFVLVVPVFSANAPHSSVQDRRSNIWGWAIASVSMRRWLLSALPKHLEGLSTTVLAQQVPLVSINRSRQSAPTAKFTTERKIRFGAHEWNLRLSPGPDYIRQHRQGRPIFFIIAGIFLAAIFWKLIQTLTLCNEATQQKNSTLKAALQESEERWRFALEGGDDGVWMWNGETGTTEFSSRCDTILGVPTSGSAQAKMHPDDVAPEKAAMQACLEGRSALYLSEHRMRGEDGKWRWISARGMVLARTSSGAALRMIGIITDISERKKTAEQLNALGQADALTGLPNRTLFFSILQHAIQVAKRNKSLLAILYLDVDKLKSFNDNFGRMTTDRLLRELAKTLHSSIRNSDVVAHFGGDDFVILLPAISNAADVQRVSSKIQEAVSKDFVIQERSFHITTCMGIEIFPLHARTAEAMINMALRAVRAAKRLGHNQVFIGHVSQTAKPSDKPTPQSHA